MRGKAERTGPLGRAGPSFLGDGGGGGPGWAAGPSAEAGLPSHCGDRKCKLLSLHSRVPVRGALAYHQQPRVPSEHRCLSHGCSQPDWPKPQESCHCLPFTLPGSCLLPAWADAAPPPSGAGPAARAGGGQLGPPEGPSASDQVAKQHVILGLSSGLMP